MADGGEWVGVTLTADEKVGGKDLDMRSATRRLNLSDHSYPIPPFSCQ